MDDPNTPSRINWFLLGAAFGLVAYPFYAVVLGPDPNTKRLKRSRA